MQRPLRVSEAPSRLPRADLYSLLEAPPRGVPQPLNTKPGLFMTIYCVQREAFLAASLAADSSSEGTRRPRLRPNRLISLPEMLLVALVTMFMNNPGR